MVPCAAIYFSWQCQRISLSFKVNQELLYAYFLVVMVTTPGTTTPLDNYLSGHGRELSKCRLGLSIGIHIYIDRVGHWQSFLLLIPGKTYKLGTSETCDVTGQSLFIYDIYLNKHLDGTAIFPTCISK